MLTVAYCFTLSSSTLVFYNFVNGTSFVMDEAVFAYRIDTLHDVSIGYCKDVGNGTLARAFCRSAFIAQFCVVLNDQVEVFNAGT